MVTKAAEQAANAFVQGGVRQFVLPLLLALLTLWFVYQNWDTISTAARKLETVDKNAVSVSELKSAVSTIERTLIDLKDFEGDLSGTVDRLSVRVAQNTDWRNEQEKRATTRIAEQGFRESRLVVQEKKMEAMDKRIDGLLLRLQKIETLMSQQNRN